MDDGSIIYTVEDLTKILKITRLTVTRMIERDELPPPVWLGRKRVWAKTIIHKWLEAGGSKKYRDSED